MKHLSNSQNELRTLLYSFICTPLFLGHLSQVNTFRMKSWYVIRKRSKKNPRFRNVGGKGEDVGNENGGLIKLRYE